MSSVVLLNEVEANLTWYQLNSDFKDPMYQSMLKLQQAITIKLVLTTNYTLLDDFVVNQQNGILKYGNYKCSATGKEAYWDSFFSCLLFQLPFFLEHIQIGYIGIGFILPIMLISIFGGIKESYRWFILNQAIWDAFLCYDFICSKPTLFGWSNKDIYFKQNTCFYRYEIESSTVQLLFQAFRIFLKNASFIPIFHLALSRFLAMYFPRFYKNFTKNNYKIVIFIILFNAVCFAAFAASSISTTAVVHSLVIDRKQCDIHCSIPQNITYCKENVPKYFQCVNALSLNLYNIYREQQKIAKILKYISLSIPPLMFFLSIICAGFLFYKIASQLKFQLKTNRDSFKQTIKISTVVGFQCLTMSVIFVITGIQKFIQIQGEAVTAVNTFALSTYSNYDELPPWLLLLQYYTTTTSLNMIRILLDSCIILTVLSGYLKAVVSTVKFLWLCLTSPKKAFKKIKYKIRGTEVTVLSTTRK